MTETIDSVTKARLQAVLAGQSVTEADLRKLFEEAQACALILNGQLEDAERRLAELASDPDTSISELAAAFRRRNELRPDRDELNELIAELDSRARQFRTSWLSPS